MTDRIIRKSLHGIPMSATPTDHDQSLRTPSNCS
jgi:hypothetical protein